MSKSNEHLRKWREIQQTNNVLQRPEIYRSQERKKPRFAARPYEYWCPDSESNQGFVSTTTKSPNNSKLPLRFDSECTTILYHAQCCYTCYFLYIQREMMAQTEISIIPFILCSLFEFLTDSVTDSFPIKLAETASYRSTYDGTDPWHNY